MKININNIEDIFKAGKASDSTMKLKGFELITEIFCDNSGVGSDNEMAYTRPQVIAKVTELIKEHGELTAKITGVGQFQIWLGLFKKSGKSELKTISKNVYESNDNGKRIIRLYDTDIVLIDSEAIILNSGGFRTATTSKWINKYLPQGVRVYQKNYEWYVSDTRQSNEVITPFIEGITVKR